MPDNHRGEKRGEVRDRPMFSVFGDISGALMYGHFRNSHSETGTTAGAAIGGLTYPVLTAISWFSVNWNFRIGLGYVLDCDKMHLGIRAGYELQYWFRQNQNYRTSIFQA